MCPMASQPIPFPFFKTAFIGGFLPIFNYAFRKKSFPAPKEASAKQIIHRKFISCVFQPKLNTTKGERNTKLCRLSWKIKFFKLRKFNFMANHELNFKLFARKFIPRL
jgi:hypothetical protein